MRIGITVWDGVVGNTGDFAREILISDPTDGERTIEVPSLPGPGHLATWLASEGIEQFVCGALSRRLEEALAAHGIDVKGFVMGDAQEVLAACRAGGLDERYAMPGCRRRRRRRGGRGPGDGRGRR